jgi:hypothetical protein
MLFFLLGRLLKSISSNESHFFAPLLLLSVHHIYKALGSKLLSPPTLMNTEKQDAIKARGFEKQGETVFKCSLTRVQS